MAHYKNDTPQLPYAVLLDCRSLAIKHLPLDSNKCCIMVFNSIVRHEVGGGEYGDRRKQCAEAMEVIAKALPQAKTLRDVDRDILDSLKKDLGQTLYRRACHVVDENARVQAAAMALDKHDIAEFGRLMSQSHCSARDLYEISCEEIDFLVDRILNCDGAYGARLSGGGFGGAAVATIKPAAAESIRQKVASDYKSKFGIEAGIYIVNPWQGIEIHGV